MCGIFGLTASEGSDFRKKYNKVLNHLFILSESRGKEASGFASINNDEILFHKTPFSASKLIKSTTYKDFYMSYSLQNNTLATIGHSRLVTNGYEHFNKNNQPVVKNGICVVHNGIIVNQADIWKEFPNYQKVSDLDTELIPTIIGDELASHNTISIAVNKFYSRIYGMTTIAAFFESFNNLLLATNNGSLYYTINKNNDAFIFASENYILQKLLEKNNLGNWKVDSIKQLEPDSSLLLNLRDNSYEVLKFDELNKTEFKSKQRCKNKYIFEEIKGNFKKEKIYINTSFEYDTKNIPQEFIEKYKKRKEEVSQLKRCKRCILPETFPFIEFDEQGLCNYCNNYKKIDYYGLDELEKLLVPIRKTNGKHDVLMPFSGGRDSSFALHLVKKELGMNPLAFSYDWGMITDLARRNQARMCDKLKVEHIYISADIREKRKYIQKNVSAWLKKPSLGTIPLFMAGDKQYFYYAYKLQKDNDLSTIIMGENHLEKTGFKTAFSGAKQTNKGFMAYSINPLNKLRMLSFYAREYITNPAYINASLLDTFTAFISYYIYPHKYINLYDYFKWNEDLITNTLLDEYDWETDPGTRTTWRIGDGTAAFYNYIYFMVAGFTENDTFRSNQIREGGLTKEEALQKSIEENKPRWDSIKWYCNTIQIDFKETIKIINDIDALI